VSVEELYRRSGLEPGRPTIALLPGSRPSEIARLLPPLLGAAERLAARHPAPQFLVPVAPGLAPDALSREIERARVGSVRLHAGDFPEILTLCAAGAVASGTASLEAALAGLPIVVVYRMAAVSWIIGRALVHVDHVALPNLIAGRRIVPELIQGQCTPDAIAGALATYLDDARAADRVRADLAEVRGRLGTPGAFARAARAVLDETIRPG
jgi:lipid-A-disaccharide synthase